MEGSTSKQRSVIVEINGYGILRWSLILKYVKLSKQYQYWECYLFHSFSRTKFQLPDLDCRSFNLDNFFKCVMTCLPTEEGCNILLAHKELPLFYRSSLYDTRWSELEYGDFTMETLWDVAVCRGKVYGIYGGGKLICIDIQGDDIQVDLKDTSVPTYNLLKKQRLVASHVDLFVVQRDSIFDFQVFRIKLNADADDLRWKRLVSLSQCTFVVSDNSSTILLGDDKYGPRPNCIYFSEDQTLYIYDLANRSFHIQHQPESYEFRLLKQAHQVRVKKKNAKENKEEHAETTQIDQFDVLPLELEILIAKKITTGWANFRATCKRIRSLLPPVEWKSNPQGIPLQYPWLMFFHNGIFHFHDPMSNITHPMNIDTLKGSEICCSKDGWLLVRRFSMSRSLFFYQPFSNTIIQLPWLQVQNYCFDCISFSASPTCLNWSVFGISHVSPESMRVSYLACGREDWEYITINNEKGFRLSINNIVFWNQSYYCLGHNGSSLGVFELKTKTWHVQLDLSSIDLEGSHKFLACNEEELILISYGHLGDCVDMHKLNMAMVTSGNKWNKKYNLRSKSLFLSRTSSMAIDTTISSIENTIQFSSLRDGDTKLRNIFYSITNKRFQIREDDYGMKDLNGTTEMLQATWIQPILLPNSSLLL